MPQGYSIQFPEEGAACELRIQGLNAVVSKLQRDGVEAYLDVAAWMEQQKLTELTSGQYQIPVTVNLPANVEVLSEAVATVTITSAEDARSI